MNIALKNNSSQIGSNGYVLSITPINGISLEVILLGISIILVLVNIIIISIIR